MCTYEKFCRLLDNDESVSKLYAVMLLHFTAHSMWSDIKLSEQGYHPLIIANADYIRNKVGNDQLCTIMINL